jgi:hypothetical protein
MKLLVWAALLAIGCATPEIIPLRPRTELAGNRQRIFRVVTTVEDGADPLSLQGSHIAFANVGTTLSDALESAATPWAGRHAARRPGGWELHVDVIRANAESSHGHVAVELGTRVTLSGHYAGEYLAQTHGFCKETSKPGSDDPSVPVNACMEAMAHDLAGWLEGISP